MKRIDSTSNQNTSCSLYTTKEAPSTNVCTTPSKQPPIGHRHGLSRNGRCRYSAASRMGAVSVKVLGAVAIALLFAYNVRWSSTPVPSALSSYGLNDFRTLPVLPADRQTNMKLTHIDSKRNVAHAVVNSTESLDAWNEGKTLALLYPPGLLGGYRNQVLRFIAFCVYARRHNMSKLLLPSLVWSTQLDGIGTHVEWFPIPFDWIFDVDHWNSFSPAHLPLLVDQAASGQQASDCWMNPWELEGYNDLRKPFLIDGNDEDDSVNSSRFTHMYTYNYPVIVNRRWNASKIDGVGVINHLQRAVLLKGTLRPLVNISIPFISGQLKVNPRRQDLLSLVKSCRSPYAYGGGTGAGRLWKDYVQFQQQAKKHLNRPKSASFVPFETDVWVYRALQPAKRWRDVARLCVTQHAPNGHYIALHARVELEIMDHICGLYMEKNLTRIIQHVSKLYDQLTGPSSSYNETSSSMEISGMFIAVSRAGISDNRSASYEKYKPYADENLRTLDRLTKKRKENVDSEDHLFLTKLAAFECGEKVLQQFYTSHTDVPNHGALLQSVINFHIAVTADVFVGVEGSSYSTDVLTTRYWLGKGNENYRYTKSGIDRVENGGLPPPHSNCKKRTQPTH